MHAGGDDDVSVIDLATNTKTGADIGVGDEPFAIAITPDGARAYVANGGDDDVSVIDLATNTKTGADIAVGDEPATSAITPDQPPLASFTVSSTQAGAAAGLAGPALVQTGQFARFDSSASTDSDGEIATYDWEFGDGHVATGASAWFHAYAEPGTYTARLTLTDEIGCSTAETFTFTGKTAYCNGGAGATATAEVTVADGLGGLALKLKRKLKGSKLRAKATCEAAACSATLKGKLTVKKKGKGKGSAAASKAKLKPKTVDLVANETTTVKLKIKRKGRSAVKRALRRGGKVKAKVNGKATDVFGNGDKAKAKAKLR